VNISSLSSSLNQVNNSLAKSSVTGDGLENKPAGQSFGEILGQKLEEVNSLQKNVDQLTDTFLAGGPVEIHEMLIAAEKADIALRQTVAVRDKVIDAYKQIANMQI
jgi:flagellar hook-basal body complex protein FliE